MTTQFTAAEVKRWNKSRESNARPVHSNPAMLRFYRIGIILERALLTATVYTGAFVIYRIVSAFMSGRVSAILSVAHLAAR